jgi:hypothetical protein
MQRMHWLPAITTVARNRRAAVMDDVGCQGASVEFKGKGTGARRDNRSLRSRDDRSKSTFV